MRKLLWLLLVFLSLVGCAKTDANDIKILPEKSSMIDFYEDDGIIHITCMITIYNSTNEDVTVRISGYSQEDVNNGLLRSPYLSATNVEEQSEFFLLKAGQYSEYLVDFCGEYAGNLQKKDRLVPDIIELEIVKYR